MKQHSDPTFSLIELEGEKLSDSCRYCDDTTSPKAAWHISSSSLNVADYRLLMDQGWRRHGNHVYKTMNRKTCCPAYPIRCDTQHFRISKAQKRVLNIVANFLQKGKSPNAAGKSRDVCIDSVSSVDSLFDKNDATDSSPVREGFDVETSACVNIQKPAERNTSKDSGIYENASQVLTNGRSGSSKRNRWQAKQERMAQRAEKTGVPYEEILKADSQSRKNRSEKNQAKEIEEYLEQEKAKGNAVHTLDIRLCKCSPRSSELSETLDEEYKLYYNYQVGVHHAAPASISPEAFEEFLVDSNLVNAHDAAAEVAGAPQFGSYHQQYWLDGKKLIAVSVVDLVPGCLSSVYFFYDPEYAFLSLGTYSALREIAFVRHLQRTYGAVVPALADFTQYYLGYYIHSCPKMHYKAQFSPSYLACPETHAWVPIEKCKRLLDQSKYRRFAEEDVESASTTQCGHETKLQLPFSLTLASTLPKGGFAVEGKTIVTTLNYAEGVVSKRDLQLMREWTSLVNNTGTMCISCTN
uniref:Arginyl-tRNA--protein transferase 1 n=1 Tax=Echinococcus granulosus TaxID=6210 RepID=A0A068WWU4_ECHGR|nr:arginyl tRNA protein transferase 1 [Echinococcus granulosus]